MLKLVAILFLVTVASGKRFNKREVFSPNWPDCKLATVSDGIFPDKFNQDLCRQHYSWPFDRNVIKNGTVEFKSLKFVAGGTCIGADCFLTCGGGWPPSSGSCTCKLKVYREQLCVARFESDQTMTDYFEACTDVNFKIGGSVKVNGKIEGTPINIGEAGFNMELSIQEKICEKKTLTFTPRKGDVCIKTQGVAFLDCDFNGRQISLPQTRAGKPTQVVSCYKDDSSAARGVGIRSGGALECLRCSNAADC
ncbi:uncharacterized protein VTP21DRAFT_6893 [Calcarisporiella thermophila]|uniref:uncharacterized protein n=1 Tax=Calcarisporiella thermophila TaxID=911321 RepID=UPI0037436433